MAKINYDYPLNPTCNKPIIAGKLLTDRWYVYFYYLHKGVRKQHRITAGLNDKTDSLTARKLKVSAVYQNLVHKLENERFDTAKNSFTKSPLETASIDDLISEYLEEVKIRVVYHTYANYNTIFKSLRNVTTDVSLKDIDKEFVQKFLKDLQVKPQSKRSYKVYISTFFNWLIEEKGFPLANPTHGVRLPNNLPVERHRVHTKDDIKNIINYCDRRKDLVLKTMIYLIYGAQMRISEILKIQMGDIRLSENKIILPKGKGKVKNKIKTVLLDEPLKEFLSKLPVDYNSSDSDQYFIGIDGPLKRSKFVARFPLSTNTINSRFKKLKGDLGIEVNKTLYSFKHTGNVNLLINGADLIELMYKNGHTKISQTETYARQLIEQVPEIKYIRKTRSDIDFK